MEQALGHVTHYRNFRTFADREPDINPVWLPIPFDTQGFARLVPLFKSNWSVRASWRAHRALKRVAGNRVDAVFFHSQVTSLFSVGVMRRIPSVISLDATPINYDTVGLYYGHKPAGNGPLDRKKFQLNANAFNAAGGLVTWSDWARRSLIDDYGVPSERIRVFAPGAAESFFDIGRRRPETVDSNRRRIRVLFVGADFERKGGPLLLNLMNGPLAARCELHIVTKSKLPARPNVFVYGNLEPNSSDLRRLFTESDIFVLPTHADCLAVVLEEAAAAGLPVITTQVGALRESVDDGVSGLMIPPDDPGALQAALESLVDDAQRRVRMGRASHALASQRFDANRNSRAILDFILEVVDSHPGRRATPVLGGLSAGVAEP
jgi:glycosyltransferase involved in cell wall biosynthesis